MWLFSLSLLVLSHWGVLVYFYCLCASIALRMPCIMVFISIGVHLHCFKADVWNETILKQFQVESLIWSKWRCSPFCAEREISPLDSAVLHDLTLTSLFCFTSLHDPCSNHSQRICSCPKKLEPLACASTSLNVLCLAHFVISVIFQNSTWTTKASHFPRPADCVASLCPWTLTFLCYNSHLNVL